jgi:hypothetical protein
MMHVVTIPGRKHNVRAPYAGYDTMKAMHDTLASHHHHFLVFHQLTQRSILEQVKSVYSTLTPQPLIYRVIFPLLYNVLKPSLPYNTFPSTPLHLKRVVLGRNLDMKVVAQYRDLLHDILAHLGYLGEEE